VPARQLPPPTAKPSGAYSFTRQGLLTNLYLCRFAVATLKGIKYQTLNEYTYLMPRAPYKMGRARGEVYVKKQSLNYPARPKLNLGGSFDPPSEGIGSVP
jgi:hypothetical protein